MMRTITYNQAKNSKFSRKFINIKATKIKCADGTCMQLIFRKRTKIYRKSLDWLSMLRKNKILIRENIKLIFNLNLSIKLQN